MADTPQTQDAEKLSRMLVQRYGRAKAGRVNWESYWQEVSEYVQPNFSNTFFEGGYALMEGQKRDQKRFDGSAEIALNRFAASLESMLTPRNSRWHGLTTTNKDLNKIYRVREWYDDATDALFKHRYNYESNFASQCHEHYMGLGFIGTSAMFVDKLMPRGIRYGNTHIAQIYFFENHQGIIDEAVRRFRLNADQAIQKFVRPDGTHGLPEEIIKAALAGNNTEYFEFIHYCMPNPNRDPSQKDWRGMKYVSYYVSLRGERLLKTEGYNTFPYCISRYVKAPGELYGRSPAMQVLTNIKVLNKQKQTLLKQGHRTVDPVLLAHDDGVVDGFSLRPGAINAGGVNGDGRALVQPLKVGNVNIGFEMMEMERKEIDAAFLVDLFQILTEGPQMTATEVIERAREKGILLSPTMGRQESEFLGPLIGRELDLLMQQGLLPPMPGELLEAGGDYEVIFDSPLSRAQRSEQAAGLMRTVSWAAEMAAQTQNPAPLDYFNWDVIVPELSAIQAVPNRWMLTDDAVAQIRQGRQEAQAQQQVIQAGPTIAAIQKNQAAG